MKISEKPETPGSGAEAASEMADKKPQKRFSEVLEEKKEQPPDGATVVVPAFTPPLLFFPSHDVASVEAPPAAAAVQPEVLLTSLVREIVVAAPPGEPVSVDIQFDSRTLEGLHVRVQKAGDSVEVRFSTASEAVSRLLTANVDNLAQALAQQGFAAPVISVQRTSAPATFSGGESSSRGKHHQGGGQKRR